MENPQEEKSHDDAAAAQSEPNHRKDLPDNEYMKGLLRLMLEVKLQSMGFEVS